METATKANDPALADLEQDRVQDAFGPTKIFISMFYWQGVRGDYMADKVLSLARSGCRVSIIVGAPSREVASRLRSAARAGRIQLWTAGCGPRTAS